MAQEEKDIDFMTTGNASKLWNMSVNKVQVYCRKNLVRGAERVNGRWRIPLNAKPPVEESEVIKVLMYILFSQTNNLCDNFALKVKDLPRTLEYMSDFKYIAYRDECKLKDIILTPEGFKHISNWFEKATQKGGQLKFENVLKVFGDITQVVTTLTKLLPLVQAII